MDVYFWVYWYRFLDIIKNFKNFVYLKSKEILYQKRLKNVHKYAIDQAEARITMGMAIPRDAELKANSPLPQARCLVHSRRRQKAGPTGRKNWMILVDSCPWCGVMRPIQTTTYEQRDWLRRWNRKIAPNNTYIPSIPK